MRLTVVHKNIVPNVADCKTNQAIYTLIANSIRNENQLEALAHAISSEIKEEVQRQMLNGILSSLPQNNWISKVDTGSSVIFAAAVTSYINKAHSELPKDSVETSMANAILNSVLILLFGSMIINPPICGLLFLAAGLSLTNYLALSDAAEKNLNGLSCVVTGGTIPESSLLPNQIYLQHSYDNKYDYAYSVDEREVYGQVTLSPYEVPNDNATISLTSNNPLLEKTGYRSAVTDMQLNTLQKTWAVGALAGTLLADTTILLTALILTLIPIAPPLALAVIGTVIAISIFFPSICGFFATLIDTEKATATKERATHHGGTTFSMLGEKNSSLLFRECETSTQKAIMDDTATYAL